MRTYYLTLLAIAAAAALGVATWNLAHAAPGNKWCGCDVAAPCSDCCSPKDCRCARPHDPTARR